jgi:hypothetical protein
MLLALVVEMDVIHAAPTCSFATASPESQDMSRARLDQLQASLQTKRTKRTTAYLVIRNDKIVDEWYASGYSRTTKHYGASTAKGLMGGRLCRRSDQ